MSGLLAWKVGTVTLTLLLLGFALSPGTGAVNVGGGNVGNAPPAIPLFASAGGAAQTRNTADVLSGLAQDQNGEKRIETVSVEFTGAPGGVSPTRFDHAVTSAERSAASEPAAFGADGFKVWDSGGNDGVLSFKFQYTWTVNGAYTVRALAHDQAGEGFGPAPDLAIVVSDGFLVSAEPVLANGTVATGASWGDWLAQPGAGNVTGSNYLAIANVGSNPAQVVTVDFTPASFLGEDGTTPLPLDGNIELACAEGTALQVPQDLAFAFGAASASGSVTATFSGLANLYYCQYRLVAIPDPLLDQAYTAAFTAS